MNIVTIDFETYCDLDITKVGATKYVQHKSFRPLCCAIKVDDQPTQLWTPRDKEFPIQILRTTDKIIAHNAYFEWLVIKQMGHNLSLSKFIDTAALARRYSLPGALADAAKVICKEQKDSAGKALIKKCCTPTGNPTQADFDALYAYCIQDVEATYDLWQSLPSQRLSDKEQETWEITCTINHFGLPVDFDEISAIYNYTSVWKEEMSTLVPIITKGKIETVNQIKKVAEYCGLPNLQAETVEATLARDDIPDDVRQLLELRVQLGKSSTAKFKKLLDMYNDGYIHDNHIYYGSATGRFAGAGFQLMNLPRAQDPNPDETIRKFIDIEEIENPIITSKGLIRSMIKAKKGERLIGADYSSIEYIGLVWSAEDYDAVKAFEDGVDQYKRMASTLYNKPIDKITKEERQVGKVVVLGAGYMMGWSTLKASAKGFGVDLTPSQAKACIRAFRSLYSKVVIFWNKLQQAFNSAMSHPGQKFLISDKYHVMVYADHNYNKWLIFNLPSGRNIYYFNPRWSNRGIVHDGRHPKTKQWTKILLSPMRMVENAIQGMCRDILCEGVKNIYYNTNIMPIGLIHDEIIGLYISTSYSEEEAKDSFVNMMTYPEAWREDLPVRAEAWVGKRFKK